MKNFILIAGVVVVLLAGSVLWSRSMQGEKKGITDTCVQHGGLGMHIHPEIKIFVDGEEQAIPADIGIPNSFCMRPIHTHDTTGALHIESVQIRDFKLGEFFEVWGRDFMEFGETVTMTVNGESNLELENYIMKDGDKIELRYE